MHQIIHPLPGTFEICHDRRVPELVLPLGLRALPGACVGDSVADEPRHVLNALLRHAPIHPGIQARLGGVIAAAVAWPGGLFRYHLTRQMAQAFGASACQCDTFACAVEFFHIASLLLDDLPQMDDSSERRGRICPHLIYGEDVTILGALGLITRAYGLLGEMSASSEHSREAHAFFEKCLGTSGMLNGQARDLNYAQSKGGRKEAIAVAMGKTAPLLELALSGPALLFGAPKRTLTLLRRLSIFWGLSYQGADDLMDLASNPGESRKTPGRDETLGRPNLASLMDRNEAGHYLARLERRAKACIEELQGDHPQLHFLTSFQDLLRGRWNGHAVKR